MGSIGAIWGVMGVLLLPGSALRQECASNNAFEEVLTASVYEQVCPFLLPCVMRDTP